MRCENGTRFYIDDFVEDLNYRKIILSFGDVDPKKLKSKLEDDNTGHMYRFDGCRKHDRLFYIENCDFQDAEVPIDIQDLVIEEGYSIVALHYDEKGDQWYFDIDAFVSTFIEL